jgi:hypothetical protein
MTDGLEELKKALADQDEYHPYIYHEGDDEFEYVNEYSNGSGRWFEYMTTILRDPNGQYYAIDWNQGLTEYQENEYEDPRPRKVKRIEKKVTISEYVDE